MTDEEQARLAELADKLDTGGLTTAEMFELAHLTRCFMEAYDERLAEFKRLLKNERTRERGYGWGYPH